MNLIGSDGIVVMNVRKQTLFNQLRIPFHMLRYIQPYLYQQTIFGTCSQKTLISSASQTLLA